MRFGAANKFLIILLFCFTNSCGQTEAERIAASHKLEDKALELRQKGELQKAILEQRRAVELNSNAAEPLVVLAGMYIETEDRDNAIETARRAIEIDPKQAWARHLYANALRRQGKNGEALEQAKKAVELEPNSALFLTNIGTLYGVTGDDKSETEAYEKALKIDPNYPPALYNLALIKSESNDLDGAISLLSRIIDQTQDANGSESKNAKRKLEELQKLKDKP